MLFTDYCGLGGTCNLANNWQKLLPNLETGHISTVDAPLAMELMAQAAFHATKNIQHGLDIGSGAGNNTLKLLQYASSFDIDLVDLSVTIQRNCF